MEEGGDLSRRTEYRLELSQYQQKEGEFQSTVAVAEGGACEVAGIKALPDDGSDA